jgi:predicted nucleic acid-binding Zn ribbon protein
MARKNCIRLVDHPIFAEFHSTKNIGIDPCNIAAGTETRLWWKCSACPHEWQASGSNRARGHRCPACKNRTVTAWNNMAVTHPMLAREFHPEKNGVLKSTDIVAATVKRLWWKCRACSHEWQAQGFKRASGDGCPACANQVVTAWNNMAVTHPHLEAEFHPRKNGSLKPTDIVAGTRKRLWWQCSRCGYEWQTQGFHRARNKNNGCKNCFGNVFCACMVCGKPIKRKLSQMKGRDPACSHFCANILLQEKWRKAMPYSPAFLRALLLFAGDGCAAPGCVLPQSLSKNEWHACDFHLERIKRIIYKRRWERNRLLADI